MPPVARWDPVAVLTLRAVRAYIRNSSARGGVVFFALLYGLGAAFSGGMVLIAALPGGYTFTVLWSGGPGASFWNYPGILLVAPWGVVSLPFFPTFAMVVCAIGVGYGMTVAFLLSVALIRNRRKAANSATATSTVAGLTPALITLVTLGACCSTTAAASAGVGVVAVTSGTTTVNLLVNNWFLGVFQIVIVWVALLAQEMLLIVYANLFEPGIVASSARATAPRVNRRTLASGLLRAALLVGGILWSLSMVAEWTTTAPGSAGPGWWFQWIVQHQVVALLAIGAALFPAGTEEFLASARRRTGYLLPGVIVLAGATLLFAPPPLPAWGLDGFGNQLLYVLGAPAGWGAVSTAGLSGLALGFRWGFEYLLLAGFAIAAALARPRCFGVLRWSAGVPPVLDQSAPSPSTGRPVSPAVDSAVVDPRPASAGSPPAGP